MTIPTRPKKGPTQGQLDRLKKAAIAFLQAQEIADRRLTALKRALRPITIPPKYLK